MLRPLGGKKHSILGTFDPVPPNFEASLDGDDFLFPNEVVEFQFIIGRSKDIPLWRTGKHLF